VRIAALASAPDGYRGGGSKSDGDYTHTTPLNAGNDAHSGKNQTLVDNAGYFGRGTKVWAHNTVLPSMCRIPGTVIHADLSWPGNEEHDNSKTPGALGTRYGWNGNVDNIRVQCLYSNLAPDFVFNHWKDLEKYLVTDTDIKLAKQQACLSGHLGNKLASNTYCNSIFESTGRFTKTDFDIAVLKSIQTADDLKVAGNLTYLSNACKVTNTGTNQELTQACIDASKKLPTNTWDAIVINGINSFNTQATGIFPTEVIEGLDNQMKSKCDTTNGRTDKSCACFNAVKFGLDNCEASIKGCEDIAPYVTAMNSLKSSTSGAAIGAAIKASFQPRAIASACKGASSETALYESQPAATNIQLGVCLTELQNTNSTAGNISQKCNIQQDQTINTYISNPILTPSPVNPSAAAGTAGFACTVDTQCTAPLKCVSSTGACGVAPVPATTTTARSANGSPTSPTGSPTDKKDNDTEITDTQKMGAAAFCCCIILLCISLIAAAFLLKGKS
jgi:hypothetical protein